MANPTSAILLRPRKETAMTRLGLTLSLSACHLLAACNASGPLGAPTGTGNADAGPDAGSSALDGITLVSEDPSDNPLPALSGEWMKRFDAGDVGFETVFRPAQGLGPVYIRHSCASCHADDARGPGAVRKMIRVDDDGWTPAADQSAFPFGHTVRPQSIAPEVYAGIDLPEDDVPGLLVTSRLGPAVFGRGAMEAVAAEEIERLEAEQAKRSDGISGRINRVRYASEANTDSEFQHFKPGQEGLIGRFGLKARIATLDEFAADALQGDMGMTSPLRPEELPNPAGAEDDERTGVDVDLKLVNDIGDYTRLLRIPSRGPASDDGAKLFAETKCAVCHVPELATDPDYPIAAWAAGPVAIYTDMLLHSMGVDLADGMEDGSARGDEWRTAPLMGIRLLKSFMHDGRAETVRQAIAAHASEGSEANGSVRAFEALSDAEQQTLIRFVETL